MSIRFITWTVLAETATIETTKQRFKTLKMTNAIKLFENKKIRVEWDSDKEKWFFSIVDVIAVLTGQDYQAARKYWNKLAQRLRDEGNESVTNCHQLKLKASDGKYYKTDVADTEQLLRLVQSIPSKKAEPFKMWLAKVGRERSDTSRTKIKGRFSD